MEHEEEYISRCVVCGEPIDYCQGHGEEGQRTWDLHDDGIHTNCHPDGCDEHVSMVEARMTFDFGQGRIRPTMDEIRISLSQMGIENWNYVGFLPYSDNLICKVEIVVPERWDYEPTSTFQIQHRSGRKSITLSIFPKLVNL